MPDFFREKWKINRQGSFSAKARNTEGIHAAGFLAFTCAVVGEMVVMIAKCWVACLLLLFSGLLYAGDKAPERSIRMVANGEAGAEFQLEARQAPLAQVLNEIARKSAVPVHYSVLPEGLVTATCVGSTLKRILECLLGPRVDLVFQYSQGSAKTKRLPQPVEVWLLGSTMGSIPTGAGNCPATVIADQDGQPELAVAHEQTGEDKMDALLEMAKAKDPGLRASALSRLATEGPKNDANVQRTVEQALSDQNADVRAQAVFALAQLEGAGAAAELQQALHDSDAAVRLMALDYVENDITLLRQVINDPDEAVRTRVAMKLKEHANTVTP